MKTRSSKRKCVKNTSIEKIDLPQPLANSRTQIEKVYAERGKINDNFHSPVFNIHVHVTNSNKNSSHTSPIQPIIHLHIGEKELQKLSQKKPKSSPTKRGTKSSPRKIRGKSRCVSPQEVKNKIVSNADLKNYLITDYLTCATPLTSKLENKNIDTGKYSDSKSVISSENPKIVSNDFSKEELNGDSPFQPSASEIENECETNVIVSQTSPSLLPMHDDYNLKEASVVIKDIDCEKNIHNKKYCPKKINSKVVVSPIKNYLIKGTNSVGQCQDTLNPDIHQNNIKEKDSNGEVDFVKEGEVSISSKTTQTSENNSDSRSFYSQVYSSSDESCSENNCVNNESEKDLVEQVSSSPVIICTGKRGLSSLNDLNKKTKRSVKNNLHERFMQVEKSGDILPANENTLTETEELRFSKNSHKESSKNKKDNSDVSEVDSDAEISPQNWSTESLNGCNFSEILQKLSGASKKGEVKSKSASPLIRKHVQSESSVFSDEEKVNEIGEKKNENEKELLDVSPKKSSNASVEHFSDKERQKSPQKNFFLSLGNEKESWNSGCRADPSGSAENFSNHKSKCHTTTESFSSDSEETNVQRKKVNNVSQCAQVSGEQTLKLHSQCKIINVSENLTQKEEIELTQKKKKAKESERDEISVGENLKEKQLINPFRLMDGKQVVISEDSCTENGVDTVSPAAEKFKQKNRNKSSNKKRKERSCSIEYLSKTIPENPPCKEKKNLKEREPENYLENGLQNSKKKIKKKTNQRELDDLEVKDENSGETPQSSFKSKATAEEEKEFDDLDSIILNKVQKLSEESKSRTNGFLSSDEDKRKTNKDQIKLKSHQDSSNEVENNDVQTNENMSEDRTGKINEKNSHVNTSNTQKDALLGGWSSEESLFRQKKDRKKHSKKIRSKKSSKWLNENQEDFLEKVNKSEDEKVTKKKPDSDEEPPLVIDDFSESEISFFFDDFDCKKERKKKHCQNEVEQNKFSDFSPKSSLSTCSKDLFLSQDLEAGNKEKIRERSSTKKKKDKNTIPNDSGRCSRSENIKKFLDFNMSPSSQKEGKEQNSPTNEKHIDDDDNVGNEFDKTEVSKSEEESIANGSKKDLQFSPGTRDKQERENKLEKIRKWIQDNSSPSPVEKGVTHSNVDGSNGMTSPISESKNNCSSDTKKKREKRKRKGSNFDEKKTESKKNKSKLYDNQDRQIKDGDTMSESESNSSRSSEQVENDVSRLTVDSGVDNTMNVGSGCQITTKNSDKVISTQTEDSSNKSGEKEKSVVAPKIFLKVTKSKPESDECKAKKKKKLKSVSDTSSLDFQLDLIRKEMNKRGLAENKKKKLKKKGGEKPAKEVKQFSEDATKKGKRKKRKEEKDELQVPGPAKKTKTFEAENYIPLDAEGPTKFSVAVLDKVQSRHDAADFKERMLFGDRVKRFSKSNTLGVMKMKQKATEAVRHNDY